MVVSLGVVGAGFLDTAEDVVGAGAKGGDAVAEDEGVSAAGVGGVAALAFEFGNEVRREIAVSGYAAEAGLAGFESAFGAGVDVLEGVDGGRVRYEL
nr:hypothetical protein [Pelagicoccus mobilis]